MIKTSRARLLVVEDVKLEAKLLMRALADFGYANITHCTDVTAALAAIEASAPQIVITDLTLGAQNGCELTRAIRARDNEDYVYVIMLTGGGSEARLREAFEAGVDDFIVKPFQTEEMVARIRAGERILEFESRLRIRSKELETALRRIDVTAAQRALAKAQATSTGSAAAETTGLDGLVATSAWGGAAELLAKSLADFLQLPCKPTGVRDEFTAPFVADVLLSDPTRQLEVGIAVLADEPSMRAMALHLLGDDDVEGAKALVLEIANIMMGSLKTAFSSCGYGFVGSIPADHGFREARAALDAHPVRHRISLRCGDANVELWLRAGERKNLKVLAKTLVEGMVICEDVHDSRGVLLIRGGSRLTQTSADRIARFAPDLEVVVGNPGR